MRYKRTCANPECDVKFETDYSFKKYCRDKCCERARTIRIRQKLLQGHRNWGFQKTNLEGSIKFDTVARNDPECRTYEIRAGGIWGWISKW